jgi:hypothetical protein
MCHYHCVAAWFDLETNLRGKRKLFYSGIHRHLGIYVITQLVIRPQSMSSNAAFYLSLSR